LRSKQNREQFFAGCVKRGMWVRGNLEAHCSPKLASAAFIAASLLMPSRRA
jgi:hypothetical protein